jgi:hypothetical protein
MLEIIKKVKTVFSNHDDFFIETEIVNDITLYFIGFSTILDVPKSKMYVQQMAASSPTISALFSTIGREVNVDINKINKAVLAGNLVLVSENGQWNAIVDPIAQPLNRSLKEPKNESPIQASMDAFGENIQINIGIIRQRLNTERLCLCSYQVGELEKRNISMLYVAGKAPTSLIEQVERHIKRIDSDIETMDDLNKYFGHRKISPVSHFFATELPIQAIHALKENRVVLFLDHYPFAIIFPHLLRDMVSSANDRNFPFVLAAMLRVFRAIGAIVTLILPALYVSLVSVNPEAFKTDLALFVLKSREGIPLSAFLETITMVILVDLILEAIVRLPKTVGPAVTMVGGIILGQAMVEARLVSNLLVIVITVVVVASSAIIGMQNSLYIRMLKYPILILSSIFGILGLCIGLILTVIYLASLTSNDIPYTTFQIKEEDTT